MESTLIHLCNGFIKDEYFSLLDAVNRMGDRVLLVSVWSVTAVLGLIAFAFFRRSRGALLVAIVASLGFWIIQGSLSVQQARYEPRMRQIEGTCFDTAKGPAITWGLSAGDSVTGPDRSIADMPFSGQIAETGSILTPYVPVQVGPLGHAMADSGIALPQLLQIALAVLGLIFLRRGRPADLPPAPVVNVAGPVINLPEDKPTPEAPKAPADKAKVQAA